MIDLLFLRMETRCNMFLLDSGVVKLCQLRELAVADKEMNCLKKNSSERRYMGKLARNLGADLPENLGVYFWVNRTTRDLLYLGKAAEVNNGKLPGIKSRLGDELKDKFHMFYMQWNTAGSIIKAMIDSFSDDGRRKDWENWLDRYEATDVIWVSLVDSTVALDKSEEAKNLVDSLERELIQHLKPLHNIRRDGVATETGYLQEVVSRYQAELVNMGCTKS